MHFCNVFPFPTFRSKTTRTHLGSLENTFQELPLSPSKLVPLLCKTTKTKGGKFEKINVNEDSLWTLEHKGMQSGIFTLVDIKNLISFFVVKLTNLFFLFFFCSFGVGREPEQQEHKGHPWVSSTCPFKEAIVPERQCLRPLADIQTCTLHDDLSIQVRFFCWNVWFLFLPACEIWCLFYSLRVSCLCCVNQ